MAFKKYFLVLTLLLIGVLTFAQAPTDVPSLAKHLTKNLTDKEDQVKILHQWVTNYIAYDYDALMSDDVPKYKPAADILEDEKALCFGYVTLMGALLDELDIPWHEVDGYTNKPYSYYEKEHYIDNHAWIAVNINGEWKMADPTWDAGYIGAIPKKDKKPNVNRQMKQIERTIKKNEKREAQGKEAFEVPKLDTLVETIYTDDVGFVKDPNKEWLLVPLDSFFTRHLPANPLWQLREPKIPIDVFYQGPEAVRKFTKANPNTFSAATNHELDTFLAHPFPDIYLKEGELNFSFCSENARTKAYAYFSYMQVLQDPEVKKYFEELPKYYSREVYKHIIEVGDTVVKYCKIAEGQEKDRYRNVLKACNNGNRGAERSTLKFVTFAEKGTGWNDRAIETLEGKEESLIRDIEKMKKLPLAPSYFANSERTEDVNLDAIPDLVSEFKIMADSLNKMIAVFDYYQEHTVLLPIIQTIQKVRYMMATRRDLMLQKQLTAYLFIDSLDAQIFREMDALDILYDDSLDAALVPREVSRVMMEMSRFMKGLNSELAERLSQRKITQIEGYIDSFRKQAEPFKDKVVSMHENSLAGNQWMIGYFEQFDNEWKEIDKLAKEQEKVGKKANEHILEMEKHNHEREMQLMEFMSSNALNWKTDLDKRY